MTDVSDLTASAGLSSKRELDAPVPATSQPPPPPGRPPSGVRRAVAALRRGWYGLTSMRTALQLLFLLALAAVPGSFLPQRGTEPGAVTGFYRNHPSLAPLLDRLSLFDVFAAPWFAAVYLLLFVSLIGCLVPRLRVHGRAMRARPPAAPKRLERLPESASWASPDPSAAVLDAVAARLRRGHWRVRRDDGAVCAEKGYLRETGNLLFHCALVLMLAGVALGGLLGYHGDVAVTEGQGFVNVPMSYDGSLKLSRASGAAQMVPFSLQLDDFRATYQPNGVPNTYDANVTWTDRPGGPARHYDIRENEPLVVPGNAFTGGTKVYLTGHGYAPHLVVRGKDGTTLYDGAVPFLPENTTTYKSSGVVKVEAARVQETPGGPPQQVAFSGFFVPFAVQTSMGIDSAFPAAQRPELVLTAYHGDLGIDSGNPQNVYVLDTSAMKQYTDSAGKTLSFTLTPGQTETLPDGTTIAFPDLKEFVNFQVTYDPGKRLVFVAAICIVAGLLLSLRIRRRRVWVRAVRDDGDEPGRTLVHAGGLARSDPEEFTAEFARLVREFGGPAAAADGEDSENREGAAGAD